MKGLLCLPLLLLLSGCSFLHLPFSGDSGTAEKSAAPVKKNKEPAPVHSVSPEAQRLIAEALEYWTDSGECTNPEAATALLDRAIAADPLDPAPYLLRSRSLGDLGYMNEAFDDATRAIRLSPTAEAYATRGFICLKQRHANGAQRDFSYAESINPDEPLIYVYRAAGAFMENRNKDACADLEKACSLGYCNPWETAKKDKLCR